MNITQTARMPFVITLFVGTSLGGAHHACAGFQTVQSSPSQVVAQNTEVSAPSEEQSPKALEVFNDRYVPDNVRKKYHLDDNWFGKGMPPAPAPTSVSQPVPSPVPSPAPELDPTPLSIPDEPKVMQANPVPQIAIESWRARKGEAIHDVLQRWSVRGGTNLMWASPDKPVLQKDFSYVGKFQDAVNELIRLEGGQKIHSQYRSEGLNPVMMAPASTVTTNSIPPDKDNSPVDKKAETPLSPLGQIFQPEEKKDERPETRWFALSGSPLIEVIQVWADDAGVRLVWQSEKNFSVKETVSQVGHFEDAVFKALNQYADDEVRPVGEMYKDPNTGQQVLLVRTQVN